MPTKRKTAIAASRPAPNAYHAEGVAAETVAAALARSIRASKEVTVGDQTPPCAILWTDPQRQWEGVMDALKQLLPELFVLGPYAPEQRTGPSIWLRSVEGGTVEPKPPKGSLPIFYLPGISKQRLREVEDCPPELQPLVELQFRGAVWLHPNGKDWTPLGFLSAELGGLGLEVGRDEATAEALLLALPMLLKMPLGELRCRRLDADAFNEIVKPDLTSEVLRWMNASKDGKARMNKDEWKVFCNQCANTLHFYPDKDGELHAAGLLGQCSGKWADVWRRFSEVPRRYPEVVRLLEKVAPATGGELEFVRETLPIYNAQDEVALAKALLGLKNKRSDEAAQIILDLEKVHRARRKWVWCELGKGQLALALEHLSLLATLIEKPLAAPTVNELGELYAKTGWEVDAAVLDALACCTAPDHEEPICGAVRALYLPWLDESARNLQNLKKQNPSEMRPRLGAIAVSAGQVVLFADGLRFDVAQKLGAALKKQELAVDVAWDWTAFPSVTATAKPHASPLADCFTGVEASDEFAVTIKSNSQRWTQDRFEALLKDAGFGVIRGHTENAASSKGWLEAGTLDKRGHSEGWKLAKTIEQEVQDLVARVRGLLTEGWREVLIVTDHGWLLMPDGLPKVDLPKFLTEHRWGRCASMKETAVTNLPLVAWHWNEQVSVASPPGVGCFKAGKEYLHGGISAQEMVVPRITVRPLSGGGGQSHIAEVKWIGLRCRVTVENCAAGILADVRGRAVDSKSSKVEGQTPKEIGADGTVSLAIPNDADEGNAAVIVLLDGTGKVVLDQKATIIGKNQ